MHSIIVQAQFFMYLVTVFKIKLKFCGLAAILGKRFEGKKKRKILGA